MKKQILFIILAAVMLFCTACTPVHDTPPPPPVEGVGGSNSAGNIAETIDPEAWDGKTIPKERTLVAPSRGQLHWEEHNMTLTRNGTLIDLATNEEFSLCFDPLCEANEHRQSTCPQYAIELSSFFLISTYESDDQLVVYATTRKVGKENGMPTFLYQFIRYDQKTQTIDVLLETSDLVGSTWYFDPYTRNIYYMAYRSASESGMAMYALDVKSHETRLLCDTPVQMFAQYICDDMLYMYGTGHVGMVDLTYDEPEYIPYENKHLDPMFVTVRVRDGFLYYSLWNRATGGTVVPIPSEIEERFPGETEQSRNARTQFSKNFYRIDLTDDQAEPELLLSDVGLVQLSGDYLLLYDYEPRYFYSIISTKQRDYLWNDPDAPENGQLWHHTTNLGPDIQIIDLRTMEKCFTIDLEKYTIPTMMHWSINSNGIGCMYSVCYDYSVEAFLEWDKTSQYTPRYEFFVTFDLDQKVITDEDLHILRAAP